MGFEYAFAEIVGDKSDFHALLNIGSTLHKRVPNARPFRQDIHNPVEPDGTLDGVRISYKHFESAHGVDCPIDEKVHIILFDNACISSFDDDRGFATNRGGVVEVA